MRNSGVWHERQNFAPGRFSLLHTGQSVTSGRPQRRHDCSLVGLAWPQAGQMRSSVGDFIGGVGSGALTAGRPQRWQNRAPVRRAALQATQEAISRGVLEGNGAPQDAQKEAPSRLGVEQRGQFMAMERAALMCQSTGVLCLSIIVVSRYYSRGSFYRVPSNTYGPMEPSWTHRTPMSFPMISGRIL